MYPIERMTSLKGRNVIYGSGLRGNSLVSASGRDLCRYKACPNVLVYQYSNDTQSSLVSFFLVGDKR